MQQQQEIQHNASNTPDSSLPPSQQNNLTLENTQSIQTIKDGHNLLSSLSNIPRQDRLSFLKLVGLDKLRAYINTEEQAERLFKTMPVETHPLLKQTLYLFATTIRLHGSQPKLTPKPPEKVLRLATSKTGCNLISNPIALDDNDIIGIGAFNNGIQSLIVYDKLFDKIKLKRDDYKDLILLDKEKLTFAAPKWPTNRYDKLVWKDKTLRHITCAYMSHPAAYNCMIPLPNGTWMILSQEITNVSNYCNWSISILEPSTFEISRELQVNRSHYAFVNCLTLLPDGKTVIAWDNSHPVKQGLCSGCHREYKICMIDISDNFSLQAITLPITPQQDSGTMSQITVQGNDIEIEITFNSESYLGVKNQKVYYSFEFSSLVDRAATENTMRSSSNSASFFHTADTPSVPTVSKTPSLVRGAD